MERLYRDEDGNYDTFTRKYDDAYGGKAVDFPEKDKVSGDGEDGYEANLLDEYPYK